MLLLFCLVTWLALLPHTRGESCNIHQELNVQRDLIQQQLVQIKSELLQIVQENEKKLRLDMESLREELEMIKAVNAATKENLKRKEVEMLKKIEDLQRENQDLTIKIEEVASLDTSVNEALPRTDSVAICGYTQGWNTPSATITYDSLLVDNSESGQLDTESGVFTCLAAGLYSVSFSGQAYLDPGEYFRMFVLRNGKRVEESRFYAQAAADNGNAIYQQGSRNLVLALEEGDTLELETDSNYDSDIYRLVFCIS